MDQAGFRRRPGSFVTYERWETRDHLAAPRMQELVPQMLDSSKATSLDP
ncbi:hypothetical protein [Nonomuraea diastatica]|nr:hypothetical protein [Nonomuraea diastatica]